MSKSASTHERVVAVVGEIDGLLDEIRGRAHWVMHVSRLQQELDEVGTLQRAMAQEADLSDEMALDGSELVGVPLDATCGLLQGVVELLSRATDELNQMCGKHQATAKQMATVLLTRRLQRLYRVIHDRAEGVSPADFERSASDGETQAELSRWRVQLLSDGEGRLRPAFRAAFDVDDDDEEDAKQILARVERLVDEALAPQTAKLMAKGAAPKRGKGPRDGGPLGLACWVVGPWVGLSETYVRRLCQQLQPPKHARGAADPR